MIKTTPITAKVSFRQDTDFFNAPEFVVNKQIREILLNGLMKQI